MTQITGRLNNAKVMNGLRKLVDRLLSSSVREISVGNKMGANEFLGCAATMILRYEFYALNVGGEEEEHLKELKEKY